MVQYNDIVSNFFNCCDSERNQSTLKNKKCKYCQHCAKHWPIVQTKLMIIRNQIRLSELLWRSVTHNQSQDFFILLHNIGRLYSLSEIIHLSKLFTYYCKLSWKVFPNATIWARFRASPCSGPETGHLCRRGLGQTSKTKVMIEPELTLAFHSTMSTNCLLHKNLSHCSLYSIVSRRIY